MKLSGAVKVGDKVRCVNSKGWDAYEMGGIYTVTHLWMDRPMGFCGVHIDGRAVSQIFFDDFEVVE